MSHPAAGLRLDRWVFAFTLLLWSAVTLESVGIASALDIRPGSALWLIFLLLWGGILLLLLAGFLHSLRRSEPARYISTARLTVLRPAALPLFVILAAVVPSLVLFSNRWPYPFDRFVGTYLFRTLLFWLVVLVGSLLLLVRNPDRGMFRHLAATGVLYALAYRMAMFFPMVSAYPFAIDWSDTSHLYYTSLFFSDRFYGFQTDLPVLNPARYLLQSLPFLVGSRALLVHRAWQAALWIGSHLLTGWALTRRLRSHGRLSGETFLFGAWAVLFLLQGPIWYYLSVIVILILLGVDPQRPARTLLIVAFASAWAGLSRINWIPFPAVLAGLLFLLEVPRDEKRPAAYLSLPLLWGAAGLTVGFMAQWLYVRFSGNPPDYFSTSLTSDLLWYRLWPNSTFVLGQVPGALLLLLPPAASIAWLLRGSWRRVPALTLAGAAGALGLYFFGGLVVSVKIGGGDNLHNLDGFIVLLLVLIGAVAFGRSFPAVRLPQLLIALLIAVPAGFALAVVEPLPSLDGPAAAADMAVLNGLVNARAAEGGEVLWITERHVIPFGQVPGVRLVEDYEKVMLMEMAMAHNRAYLDRFHADLAGQRFVLIVADQVNYTLLTRARAFSEENNIWDQNIDYDLLCHYEVAVVLESAGVDVLTPRAEPKCPPRMTDPVE